MNYRELYTNMLNDHLDQRTLIATTTSGESVHENQLCDDADQGAFAAWNKRPEPSEEMFFHTLLPGANIFGDLPHRDIYPYLTARSLRFIAFTIGHASSPRSPHA